MSQRPWAAGASGYPVSVFQSHFLPGKFRDMRRHETVRCAAAALSPYIPGIFNERVQVSNFDRAPKHQKLLFFSCLKRSPDGDYLQPMDCSSKVRSTPYNFYCFMCCWVEAVEPGCSIDHTYFLIGQRLYPDLART